MNKYLLILLSVLIAAASGAYAKTVKGMIKSVDNSAKTIVIAAAEGDVSVRADASSKLTRGLVNTKPFEVGLLDYSPGDSISCEVSDSNLITKASASFDMISGVIIAVKDRTLSVDDGSETLDYAVAEKASIYLESSSVLVDIDKLKVGNSFYARINPDNKNIWTLIVVGFEEVKPVTPPKTEPVKPEPVKPEPAKPEPVKPEPAKPEPAKPEPAKPEPAKPEPAKPEPPKTEPVKPEPVKPEPAKPEPANTEPVTLSIDNVQVSSPDFLKAGDIILVNVIGTTHAGVSCDFRYVDGTKTVLKEESAGSYIGFVKVPQKNINKAKLMVYMSSRGVNISSDSGYVMTVSNKNAVLSKIGTIVKIVPEAPAPAPAAPVEASAAPVEAPAAPAEASAAPVEAPAAPVEAPAAPAEAPAAPVEAPAAPAEAPAAPVEAPAAPVEAPAAPAEAPAAPVEAPAAPVEAPAAPAIAAPSGDPAPAGSIEGAQADSQNPLPSDDRGIYITSPVNNAGVKDITVSGTALPGRMLICTVMYSNNKTGILNISGVMKSDVVTVREDGGFIFGPVPLTGVFATNKLKYYVTVSYADQELADVPSRALTLCYE